MGPNSTVPSPVPETATQHMVAMRDGVRLATDVYLPPAGGPVVPGSAVPAVLVRLPYDKNSRYVFMEQVASTDIYAKLCDRAPDGSVHQIARGQGVLTQPGAASLARIELGHTGYRLRPGHRLHLQIASSDYPEFPPNSGTTENRWTAASRAGSRQVLHTDAAQPSHLVLTVANPDQPACLADG